MLAWGRPPRPAFDARMDTATLGAVSEAFDVAVVGAGVVGAAIAYECAARGARVILLDRDRPGAHASGAAAGMLAACSAAHEAAAAFLLAPGRGRHGPSFVPRL